MLILEGRSRLALGLAHDDAPGAFCLNETADCVKHRQESRSRPQEGGLPLGPWTNLRTLHASAVITIIARNNTEGGYYYKDAPETNAIMDLIVLKRLKSLKN